MENISSGEIKSFRSVTLHTSGMRFVSEHEIIMRDGGKAEVSLYGIRYVKGKDERILEKRAVCDIETVLKLLNGCELLSWDGFDGPHPEDVLDGTMFSLKATVNGDQTICARGSENFPKHYREFTGGLYDILNNRD